MRSLLALALLGSACGGASGTTVDDLPRQGLPALFSFDRAAADRGYDLLTVHTVAEPAIPRAGIENLWIVWDGGYDGDYWAAFRKRYGMHEAPFDNGGLPMGMRAIGQSVTFDCLLCHASTVAGKPVLGVANSTLDIQSLLDDLEKAANLAGIKPPFQLRDRTGAAGAIDAVGMAAVLGEQIGVAPGTLNSNTGWTRAPAWWQLKHKTRVFNDGTGASPSFRTMAGILLAFGLTIDQIAQRSAEFDDIGAWILSLEAPRWSGTLDRARWERGRTVFADTCSDCHGLYDGPQAYYPSTIVDTSFVGTDPMRADRVRQVEIDTINATWFGDPPMMDTDGYLAPPLVGVWARAPYLHNGSVPDLASVLDSKSRPQVWRRTGTGEADWDPIRVGWRYDVPTETPAPDSIEGRRIYDTRRDGLHATGHPFGDDLTDEDRQAVIEYLKSL